MFSRTIIAIAAAALGASWENDMFSTLALAGVIVWLIFDEEVWA